jgi:hypothetical protein
MIRKRKYLPFPTYIRNYACPFEALVGAKFERSKKLSQWERE